MQIRRDWNICCLLSHEYWCWWLRSLHIRVHQDQNCNVFCQLAMWQNYWGCTYVATFLNVRERSKYYIFPLVSYFINAKKQEKKIPDKSIGVGVSVTSFWNKYKRETYLSLSITHDYQFTDYIPLTRNRQYAFHLADKVIDIGVKVTSFWNRHEWEKYKYSLSATHQYWLAGYIADFISASGKNRYIPLIIRPHDWWWLGFQFNIQTEGKYISLAHRTKLFMLDVVSCQFYHAWN